MNISSAYREPCFKHVDIFPLKSSCINITSTTTLNKVADSGSPCFTPDSTLNSSAYSFVYLNSCSSIDLELTQSVLLILLELHIVLNILLFY